MITLYGADISVQYANLKPVENSVSITKICTLPDATSCTVTEELNGIYELEMTYVATGINATQIEADRILGVKVPMKSSVYENYFRIYRVDRDISGMVYVYARQLSGDLSYNVVSMLVSTGQASDNVGTVEDWEGNIRAYSERFPFFFRGNLESVSGRNLTMAFSNIASVRSYLNGELESPDIAAIDLYACDFVFDKFDIEFVKYRGVDRQTVVHYSVNMDGILIDDDLDEVYTSFLLFLRRESATLSYRVNTTYAPMFGHIRTKAVDYTQYMPENMTDRQAQVWLEQVANSYAQRHNEEGNPVRQIEVDVVAANLGEVYLGDSIPVVYMRHGITVNTRMRVISYVWDVIMQRYVSVTLGTVKTSLAKEIARNVAVTDSVTDISQRLTEAEKRKVGIEIVSANGGTGFKFSDGTLICTKKLSVTVNAGSAWGPLYYNNALASLGLWPVPFTAAPTFTASVTDGNDAVGVQVKNVTASSAGGAYLYVPVNTSRTSTITLIAVGKWK